MSNSVDHRTKYVGLGLGVLGVVFAVWAAISPQAVLAIVSGWFMLLGVVVLFRAAASTAQRSEEQAMAAKYAMEQLERHKKAIDGLAEGLLTALFVCNSKAEVQYANSGAQAFFRFESPTGRSILAVTLSYELEQLVLEAGRSEGTLESEMSFTYPQEKTAVARVWREPDGERIFVSLYDITELRRLENVRRDFVANVSHELRTPLAAMRALAETLRDEPETPLKKRNEYLDRITGEVDRLSSIVSDLLVLSSAEAGRPEKSDFDLVQTVRRSIDLLRPKAKTKKLELKFEGPDEMTLHANESQMHQVAINLIGNAINYTAQGSVAVRLFREGQDVVLQVQDTGIGIASEHISRVFERFYRVDKGRSRDTGGTGLGLAIVRHIVESHGGTVAIESALHEGSTLTVRLPLDDRRESKSD